MPTLACAVFLLVDRGSMPVATRVSLSQIVGPSPAASQVLLPGLEAGACMGLAPTRAGSGQTVFIDPGHGGMDPGVVGGTSTHRVLEKDATLGVGARLSVLLRADGYRVVMARTQDSTVAKLSPTDSVMGSLTGTAEHRDLVTRTACANAAGAAALVSIHFDAYSDPAVGGTGTFYNSARTFAPASRRLATDLQAALVAALGTADRGVWTDDQIAAPTLTTSGSAYGHLIELGPVAGGWVDDPSKMPGALVEPLFLTNPAESQMAGDEAGQQRIAAALETGLVKFLAGG